MDGERKKQTIADKYCAQERPSLVLKKLLSSLFILSGEFELNQKCIMYNIWLSSSKYRHVEKKLTKARFFEMIGQALLYISDNKHVSFLKRKKKVIISLLSRLKPCCEPLTCISASFFFRFMITCLNKYFIRNYFFLLIRAWKGLDLWRAACNDTSRRWSRITAVCHDHLSSEWHH